MDEWKQPYQTQLELIRQTAETAENDVVAAEKEADTWPKTREKINTIVLVRLQEWLEIMASFLRPIDLRPLRQERRRFNIWRGITWHHAWPLRVRLRNFWLWLQILLLKLWAIRKQIALFGLLLLAIWFLFWLGAKWDMVWESIQSLW